MVRAHQSGEFGSPLQSRPGAAAAALPFGCVHDRISRIECNMCCNETRGPDPGLPQIRRDYRP
jgi:hypothetical protein